MEREGLDGEWKNGGEVDGGFDRDVGRKGGDSANGWSAGERKIGPGYRGWNGGGDQDGGFDIPPRPKL